MNDELPSRLSIEFLANAFTEEEKFHGRVFSIYGNPQTLAILSNFLSAVHPKDRYPYDQFLWTATYTEDDSIPYLTLMLGVFRHTGSQHNWPTVKDWIETPQCIP